MNPKNVVFLSDLNIWAFEAFGPLGQPPNRQTLLLDREAEGESQGQTFLLQVLFLDELRKATGNVVK